MACLCLCLIHYYWGNKKRNEMVKRHLRVTNKEFIMKTNIILCSPKGNIAEGGIYKWTDNITNYYNKLDDTQIKIIHVFDSKGKAVLPTDSIFRRIYIGLIGSYRLYKLLKHNLKHNHIDVVHICNSGGLSLYRDFLLLRIAKRYGAKVFIHFHFGRIPEILKTRDLECKILTKVLNASDCSIVMDRQSFEILMDYGFYNTEYLPNPFPPTIYQIIEKYKDVYRAKNKVVYVGQIIPTKGVFELLKACKGENTELSMVGKIPNKVIEKELTDIAQKDGTRLTLHGIKDFDFVVKELLSASVFVLPSYSEGFPNIILEAMSCACPIVATTVGAIPEILNANSDKPCGICIAPKDAEALKTALCTILNDSVYASELGKRAKEKVLEQYSVQNIWNIMQKIWLSK